MPRTMIPFLRWPIAAIVFLLPVAALYFWPMSYWYEVRKVYVGDTVAGAEVIMFVDRQINRPFFGTYNVTIHKWASDGPVSYCRTSGGPWEYRPGAVLPTPLTLSWWIESQTVCRPLAPGKYQITTRWTNLSYPIFQKSVVITSNIFTVTP